MEPEKNMVYEKETVVRNIGGKDGNLSNGATRDRLSQGEKFDRKGPSFVPLSNADDEPSMSEYLKGFSKVAKKCLKDYKEVGYDVCQSLLVLFMQHPAVGILFLVTGLFVLVPIGIFVGFAIVSFICIVVTALFTEGIFLVTGLVILLVVVPVAFIIGIGVATFATATWIAVTAVYNVIGRRNTPKTE